MTTIVLYTRLVACGVFGFSIARSDSLVFFLTLFNAVNGSAFFSCHCLWQTMFAVSIDLHQLPPSILREQLTQLLVLHAELVQLQRQLDYHGYNRYTDQRNAAPSHL